MNTTKSYRSLLLCLLFVWGCAGLEALENTTQETIVFESLDFEGELWEPFMPPPVAGAPVDVTATLTVPPTDKPLPAVIVTHGCGGISGGETGWVRRLTAAGYASLLIDSFTGRGISEICTGSETLNIAGMLVDVYRGAEALRDHPYLDADRMAVLGLSFGGRTSLWSSMTRFQDLYSGDPFDAYLSFYPSTCYIELIDPHLVSGGPIRIFHGTADDWTPISQCQEMVDRMRSGGADIELHAYEGAHHGFDNEVLFPVRNEPGALSPRNCRFVEHNGSIIDPGSGEVATVDSPCVERGVTIGFDRAARDRAVTDSLDLLAATLGGDTR